MKNKLTTRLVNFIINTYGRLYKFDCAFEYKTDEFEYVNLTWEDTLFFCCIHWNFLSSDMHEKLFPQFLRFLGLRYDLPVFVMSLLHEVGHHKVGEVRKPSNMITITQYKEQFDIKDQAELDLLIYYSIPDEYESSKWAVDFANKHGLSLTVLAMLLYPLITYTYKKHWDLMMEESSLYVEKTVEPE